MKAARLVRLLAAMVLAAFFAAVWASPSEAHPGHDAAPAAAQSDASSGTDQTAPTADALAAAGSQDCSGHGSGDATPCCSNACHAVMAEELATLPALPIAAIAAPSAREPAPRGSPILHLKRPPRPLAAMVG